MHRAVRRCQVAKAALAAQFRAAALLPSRSVPFHTKRRSATAPAAGSVVSAAHDIHPVAGSAVAIAAATRVTLATSTIGAAIATAAVSVIAVAAAVTATVT